MLSKVDANSNDYNLYFISLYFVIIYTNRKFSNTNCLPTFLHSSKRLQLLSQIELPIFSTLFCTSKLSCKLCYVFCYYIFVPTNKAFKQNTFNHQHIQSSRLETNLLELNDDLPIPRSLLSLTTKEHANFIDRTSDSSKSQTLNQETKRDKNAFFSIF
jgi:hypothetical protein